MATFEEYKEARALARLVVAGKARSYVGAGRVLSAFVLTLPVPVEHTPDCALERDAGEPGSSGLGCDCGGEDRAKAI